MSKVAVVKLRGYIGIYEDNIGECKVWLMNGDKWLYEPLDNTLRLGPVQYKPTKTVLEEYFDIKEEDDD